ncbi:LytR/AlgR family response regulator transcription factor [Simiduia agarivorans]|uniref:LytT family response regulator n=1 Tax=Simiduia agarivorans (strain DSM 21679 / JCM 13881 / BCRC 17597 / SA1) TaxID=1117647 RepID=K4KLK1_SIMAS|nr:response regulator [Simiduia agarivorans]AFV00050.1 LytT family response regulator [Simiduia agarivorans SA1 = DSM 21679]
MKTAIVEDSRLARLELQNLLKKETRIDIVGEFGDPQVAIKALNQLQPELLFLDIQMPGLNGFELLDALTYAPKVIFTTAYDQYALRSFEHRVVDYLLKPVEPVRLSQALQKALGEDEPADANAEPLTPECSVFIKQDDACFFVELKSIHGFESAGNYSQVIMENSKPMIHRSLNQLEQRLPAAVFLRANRQTIINLKSIERLEVWVSGNLRVWLKNGMEVDLSRRASQTLRQSMSL